MGEGGLDICGRGGGLDMGGGYICVLSTWKHTHTSTSVDATDDSFRYSTALC